MKFPHADRFLESRIIGRSPERASRGVGCNRCGKSPLREFLRPSTGHGQSAIRSQPSAPESRRAPARGNPSRNASGQTDVVDLAADFVFHSAADFRRPLLTATQESNWTLTRSRCLIRYQHRATPRLSGGDSWRKPSRETRDAGWKPAGSQAGSARTRLAFRQRPVPLRQHQAEPFRDATTDT